MQATNYMNVKGKFVVEQIRNGKIIDKWDADNVVTIEGRRNLLESGLGNGTQIATWYVGIYSGNVSPLESWVAAQLTGSNNPTEITTSYSNDRKEWVEALHATDASIDNSASVAVFNFTAPETVRGAMIISDVTKGSATGTLMAIANFAARTVAASDILNITYELTTTSTA